MRYTAVSPPDADSTVHVSGTAFALKSAMTHFRYFVVKEPKRRHSDDMRQLLWSGMTLDYKSLETTATRMAEEPRVWPVDVQEGVFAASFPPEYIAKEDLLYEAAHALAEGAKAKDMKAVSTGYIKLAGTCIGCHSIYLTMPDAE